jgi:hypothetical protein
MSLTYDTLAEHIELSLTIYKLLANFSTGLEAANLKQAVLDLYSTAVIVGAIQHNDKIYNSIVNGKLRGSTFYVNYDPIDHHEKMSFYRDPDTQKIKSSRVWQS